MKRFTSMCIALTLLIVVLSISPAFSAAEKIQVTEPLQETYDNALNKLHFYFGLENTEDKTGSALARTVSNEVSVDDDYFTYIDTETELNSAIENMNTYCEKYADDELIQVTVEFKSDFEKTDEYLEFQEKKRNIKTIQELRAYREELVEFSKQYHSTINTKNCLKLSALNYSTIECVDFSPFIVLSFEKDKITKSELLNLSEDSSVVNISLSLSEKCVSEGDTEWIRALKEIDVFSTVNSQLFTGDGVKIGILETTKCDLNNVNLSGKSITINPSYANVAVDSHATAVTSIISRIAPDADIYFSCVSNTNDERNSLSWFIEQGCDIINCSYGYYDTVERNTPNTFEFSLELAVYRHYADGYFDYISKANALNIVVSAGNVVTDNEEPDYNPDGYITSPGLAKNVITVGGLDCSLSFLTYKLEHHTNSCYKTVENVAKPEISAIHNLKVPNVGACSGTSFAAPQVTGALALLFEEHPAFATSSTDAKSMLIASAKKTENYSNISGSYFDDKVGAGCLNYNDGLRNCEHIFYAWRKQATSVPNGNTMQHSISLSKNDELQVGLAWSAEFNNLCYITNYDIKIYDPNGILVCSSTLDANNSVELVRYTIPSTGTYTIAVYQNGIMPSQIANDYISLVCNIV